MKVYDNWANYLHQNELQKQNLEMRREYLNHENQNEMDNHEKQKQREKKTKNAELMKYTQQQIQEKEHAKHDQVQKKIEESHRQAQKLEKMKHEDQEYAKKTQQLYKFQQDFLLQQIHNKDVQKKLQHYMNPKEFALNFSEINKVTDQNQFQLQKFQKPRYPVDILGYVQDDRQKQLDKIDKILKINHNETQPNSPSEAGKGVKQKNLEKIHETIKENLKQLHVESQAQQLKETPIQKSSMHRQFNSRSVHSLNNLQEQPISNQDVYQRLQQEVQIIKNIVGPYTKRPFNIISNSSQ